jgi:hypothetical protein
MQEPRVPNPNQSNARGIDAHGAQCLEELNKDLGKKL